MVLLLVMVLVFRSRRILIERVVALPFSPGLHYDKQKPSQLLMPRWILLLLAMYHICPFEGVLCV